MSAMPALTAVTVPPSLTAATEASVLDQSSSFFVASSGLTTALKAALSPLARVSELLSSVTPVTGTVVGGGVTEPPAHLAVSVMLPVTTSCVKFQCFPLSVNQPRNAAPSFVGSTGSAAFSPLISALCGSTLLPPAESNVMVQRSPSHRA